MPINSCSRHCLRTSSWKSAEFRNAAVCRCHPVSEQREAELGGKSEPSIKGISNGVADDPCWGSVSNKSILDLHCTYHLPCFFQQHGHQVWFPARIIHASHLSFRRGMVPLLGHTKLSLGKLGHSLPCWSAVTHWTQPAQDWGGYRCVAVIRGIFKIKYKQRLGRSHLRGKNLQRQNEFISNESNFHNNPCPSAHFYHIIAYFSVTRRFTHVLSHLYVQDTLTIITQYGV